MTSPPATLLLLLAQSLTLTLALPSSELSPRAPSCGHLESPFAFWQLFQEPSRRNETFQLGPRCAEGPPYCAQTSNEFHLSQEANAANQHDLVASYRNQVGPADPHCPGQEIKGPYTLEFQFDARDAFTSSGANKQIDVFDIDGDIPQQFDGHREYFSVPNWDNIGPLTGALVGSFEVPAAAKVIRVVHNVQKVCRMQYNFRLSFSDSNMAAGSVDYMQVNTTGLRLRFGC